jgi:uncharacterized phiE125 gp8 family phage protein
MGTLSLFTGPTIEPLTVAEAKAWARITEDAEDSIVGRLISAARANVEQLAGIALLTQVWDYFLDEFPCDEIAIPRPPLQSVTYIKYTDSAGVVQTLASSEYTVDTKRIPARIVPAYGKSWPGTQYVPNAVQVRFTAGYGPAASDIDAKAPELRQALVVLVNTLNEQREMATEASTLTEVPEAFWQLVNQHRTYWI